MFNLLHSSMNQELFEKHLCNQNSHYEKYGRFPLRREAIMCYRQIDSMTLFAVSKDEWDTKEDTVKSMKNALYILQYAKGTCRAKSMSNSEKIYPLAVIKLRLSEDISQLHTYLLSQ